MARSMAFARLLYILGFSKILYTLPTEQLRQMRQALDIPPG